MRDQEISFDTAKLAKEKGFDNKEYGDWLEQFMWYSKDGVSFVFDINDADDEDEWVIKTKDFIPQSTQSLLQKWFREKHNIQMIMKPFYDSLKKENSFVCDIIRMSDGRVIKSVRCSKYEEALEIGLQNALTLI